MSLDLILGFKEKPSDLDDALSKLGFKKSRTCYELELGDRMMPLEFLHYEVESPSSWANLEPVAYEGLITSRGAGEATERLYEVAKNLRDRYGAILLNPQTNQVIKN